MPKTLKFESLRGNLEFKKILSAKKVSSDLFTIYYTNKDASLETNKIHMSFVSAKKLGNAVKRNKIRRRLKMAARKAISAIDSFNNKYKYAVFAKSKIYDAQYGHVQFMKRSSYIDAGMENENFRGSSPEDKERFHRFTLLGYNVGRIDDQVYHLEHSRGANSWPNSVQGNPYMKENFEEWGKIQLMNKDELKEYYSTQEYLRKYN